MQNTARWCTDWFWYINPLGLIQKVSKNWMLVQCVNTVRRKCEYGVLLNKTPYSYFWAHSICIVVNYKQAKIWLEILWNDSSTQNDEQNIMFKSQCSHMWLQKSILSHVTTLTFVVTCDYIDFFLANVTVNHNVHTFTIIVHGYLLHSFLTNVVNYNDWCSWCKIIKVLGPP